MLKAETPTPDFDCRLHTCSLVVFALLDDFLDDAPVTGDVFDLLPRYELNFSMLGEGTRQPICIRQTTGCSELMGLQRPCTLSRWR